MEGLLWVTLFENVYIVFKRICIQKLQTVLHIFVEIQQTLLTQHSISVIIIIDVETREKLRPASTQTGKGDFAMSDYVNEMLSKFVELSQEEKQIAAEIDAAYKEYNDYCADSEKDLSKKIDEIRDKMFKLNHFIDYARQHADPSELEDAAAPFDTPEGTLESIRQTIKLDSRNDPNAETLYTKATGKKLYYEQEIDRTCKLIEGSKVQAKRQYDSDVAKLNKRKEEHFNKISEYVQSPDFSEYLKLLVYDKSAFNSPGTVNLNDDEHISLGQRRMKLSVPMEIEQDVALNSNGEYNAAARTIGAPFQISVKKGGTLFLEHDERNDQYLLGGIQRLLLNFVKYFGDNLTSVLFCEPEHFSAESLGNISALGKGINPFITVPKSMEEASDKVMKFAAKAETVPTSDKVSRILVLQNFPEKYTPDIMRKVLEVCKNAERNGVLVILTHRVPMDVVPVEKEIREIAEVIRSRNGGFWVERLHESLFWYSAPSDISDEVRRKYVDKRRQDAVMAAQEPESTPAPIPVSVPASTPEPAPAPVSETTPVSVAVPTPVSVPASTPTHTPEPAPAEAEENKTQSDVPSRTADYEDENLKALSVTEDGEPVPAHILFSIPRPKPEEKEVTMTSVTELSAQLPPPEPEEPEVKPVEFEPDFRPEQNLDPDMTYRITDHPPVKAPEPIPEPESEKTRPSFMDVIGAGKRKIEQFVDNRKSDNAKKVTGVNSALLSNDSDMTPEENMTAADLDTTSEVSSATEPEKDRTLDALDLELSDEPVTASEPVPDAEPEPVEDIYGKGKRKLPRIPVGKDVEGTPVRLDISGGVTYICGSRSDERKALTERVISQITADTHPDDVELWLFDCGDGEFIKYAENPAEHIRYLVLDTNADTSVDFADVVSREMEQRIETFAEKGWSSVEDIPADVFMPVIVVAVNAFPRFSGNIVGTPKYFGKNYNSKLSKMFKRCSDYGIHFLLIGDEFSENGECPACLEGCTIHSAAVVAGMDRAAHKLFGSLKLYDNQIESLKRVPAGCAFMADEDSADGLTLVRIMGKNAINEHTYNSVSEYSEELENFLDKSPFIGDRKTPSRYDDRSEYREEQINLRTQDECILFLGEPCRFMGEYPIRLYDDFGENLLAIAPSRDKSSVLLTVRAALRSLEEQGIRAEILAGRSNPIYIELLQSGVLNGLPVYEGAKAGERVKEIADMLDNGERPNVFEIVLGSDLLVASMHADDMIGVLKKALVSGPRMGTHFMFVSGSAAQTAAGFLSLFRHKLVFACPYSEAEKILRDPSCDLPENGFRLSDDYDELTILPYLM